MLLGKQTEAQDGHGRARGQCNQGGEGLHLVVQHACEGVMGLVGVVRSLCEDTIIGCA